MEEGELKQITDAITAGFKSSGAGNQFGGNTSGGNNRAGRVAVDAIAQGGKALGEALVKGGGQVSDFTETLTKNLGLLGTAFSGIVSYIDNTNTAFQGLSKVGAGFNADLGLLRMSAAETRMGFDEFGALVGNNAAALSSFNGGVNGGVKQFTALSRAMFEDGDVINGFLNLGYTVGEANEFLMTNMKLLDRQARRDGMGTEAQIAAALQLASSMDVMAKLTGKSVKEQQDQLVDAQRDGATQSKLRLLEKRGIEGVQEGFNASYTALAAGGPQLQALFQDMTQTGVPMSEMTRHYMANNQEAAQLAKQMADVNASSMGAAAKKARLEELANQAVAAGIRSGDSVQNLTMGTYGQISGIAKSQADVLESTGPLINQMHAYAEGQGAVLGDTLSYQQAYSAVIKQYTDDMIQQKNGTGQFQGPQQAINKATLDLANSASRVNMALGDQIRTNSEVSRLLESAAIGLDTFVGGAADLFINSLRAIPGSGSLEMVGPVNGTPTEKQMIDAQSLSSEDQAAFVSQFPAGMFDEDSLKVNIVKINSDYIAEAAMANAADLTSDQTSSGNFFTRMFGKFIGSEPEQKIGTAANPTANALGGNVTAGEHIKVGEQGPETMIAGFDGAIIPNMKNILNRLPEIANRSQKAELAKTTVAQAQTQLQGANSLEQKLDILNQTMLQLVSINSTQARTGEKQLKSARSNGNLMAGIGRV